MCYHIIPAKYSRRLEKITFIMAFMRQFPVNLSPMHGNICREALGPLSLKLLNEVSRIALCCNENVSGCYLLSGIKLCIQCVANVNCVHAWVAAM